MCMTEMMVLAFGIVLQFHTDVDLSPRGLAMSYRALTSRTYPYTGRPSHYMKASTVMAVVKIMMFYMSQEKFSHRLINVQYEQRRPKGVASFE